MNFRDIKQFPRCFYLMIYLEFYKLDNPVLYLDFGLLYRYEERQQEWN